jgi:hypothetical protein
MVFLATISVAIGHYAQRSSATDKIELIRKGAITWCKEQGKLPPEWEHDTGRLTECKYLFDEHLSRM